MTPLEKAKEALQRIVAINSHEPDYNQSGEFLDTREIAIGALAAIEAEKPSEDAKRAAVLAWRSNDHPGGLDWVDFAAVVIQSFADAQLSKERERTEGLEVFARSIIEWSEAYHTDIFTEPTPEQVDEVCKLLGFRIDRISAMVLRVATKPYADRASEALAKYQEEGE